MAYARRQTRPKPAQAQPHQWPAPVAGWVSNRALASPKSIDGPGAAVLDNFFPRATGVALRRGKLRYATMEDTEIDVTALFTYKNGVVEQMFGANENTIYDLSNVPFDEDALITDEDGDTIATEDGDEIGWQSTFGLDVATGYTGGDWVVTQFSTSGGVYLIGVNGVDPGFIYDGEFFYPYIEGGVTRLAYDAETAPFTAEEVVTGGTSSASGTVWRVVESETPGEGYLLLTSVTGTFQDNETISAVGGGSATAAGDPETAAPGVEFGDFGSEDMSYVWAYNERLYFTQNDSLSVWYLEADSVGGTATEFPLIGVFDLGGSLLFGQRWSLESGGEGGLSDQNIFVSTQGEVAIYQGLSPDDAATWKLVGVYRIGRPLGKHAFIRGGGDLAIATTVGLVPLSKAISLDVTALNVATVSYKIADAWTEATQIRGTSDWRAGVWPEQKLAIVAPPDLQGASSPVMFVSNTETGAWARYTGWQALCMTVFRGKLYFGSPEGRVFEANAGGLDDGAVYSGTVVPLYEDMGTPASAKIGTMVRALTRATLDVVDRVDILTDYNVTSLPPAPDATPFEASNVWGEGIWGQSVWSSVTPSVINQKWRSAGGMGYALAPCYQITSGSLGPLDLELIAIDTLHTQAGLVS
jgi:hypothetical protein